MWGRKETPEEYNARKERERQEYEERQRHREIRQRAYEERQRNREHKQRDWEARQAEKTRKQSAVASTKRNLVSRAQSYSSSTDWKQTGERMKSLMNDWKSAGYAGDVDSSLWDQFQSARQQFYDRRTAHFEKMNVERKRNLSRKEAVVTKMKRLATVINPKDAKSIRNQMKEIMSEWKSIGPVSKQDNDKLWSDMQKSMDTINTTLQDHFRKMEAQRERNARAKANLVSQAQSLASSTDWKDGKQKAQDLRRQWKAIGSAGRDKEDSLWNSFNGALDTFYKNMNKHYEKRNREFDDNAQAKQNLINQAQRIVNSTLDFTKASGHSAMKSLMREWKRTKSAGREDQYLWNEFKSLQDRFYSKRNDAFAEKDRDWENSSKNLYERERLDAKNKHGQVVGRYKRGDIGAIHETSSHYEGGKTTLHPDNSSHHHGDHAHVLGKPSKEGGSSFTRDGKPSRK